jgi:hypothetical protein
VGQLLSSICGTGAAVDPADSPASLGSTPFSCAIQGWGTICGLIATPITAFQNIS